MLHGTCLCGSVRITVQGSLEHQPEACHCTQCRKHSGSFLTGVNVRRSALVVEGEDHVGWFRSSEKVERGFCTTCGSTLFWKPDIAGYEWTSVAMGLFDGSTGAQLAKHTFVAEKGDYYDIADGVPQQSGF